MHEIGADEAVLFLGCGVVVAGAGPGVVGVVVVVAPFGLKELVICPSAKGFVGRVVKGHLTKWFANSRPGTLALEYSKSITTNCLCWFAGSKSGDSPSGIIRRIFPYCVFVRALAVASKSHRYSLHHCVQRPYAR